MNEIKLKITIDGKDAAASIALTDNELKKLAQSIRQAGEQGRDSGSKIVHAFAEARNLIQGFKETFSILSGVFGGLITSYGEQERAEIKLQTALQQTGSYTKAVMNEFNNYASQLQQTTLYGDELYLNLFGQLQAMGLTVEQTKQAAIQAANLATVMGTDLSSAARVMGDLFNGNATMINRYIKGLDETILKSGDTSKILEHLNERIGNQAVNAAQSGAGALIQFQNALDDLKETVGKSISQSITPFLKYLKDIFQTLNNSSPALVSLIGVLGSTSVAFALLNTTGIMPLILNFGKLSTSLKYGVGLFGMAAAEGAVMQGAMIGASVAVKGFFASLGPIGWAVIAIGTLTTAFTLLKLAADDAAESQKNFTKTFGDTAAQLRTQLKSTEARLEQIPLELLNPLLSPKAKEALYKEYKWLDAQKKILKDKIDALNAAKYDPLKTAPGDNAELDEEFENNKKILEEKQRHESAVLKLTSDSELESYNQKKNHFNEMIALYQKYGKDASGLYNRLIETELELLKSVKPPEIKIEPELEGEDALLKDIIDVEDYKKSIRIQSRQDELDNWYKTEQERFAQYETNVAAQTALDDEYAARKKALDQETINAQLSSAAYAFAAIGSMLGKHTALGQMAAIAQSVYNTYEAATKALTAGPILGPILAGIITALGLAQVAKIKETAPPTGYAQGGRLKKGQQGFIEGYDNEIIAPEKTFVEIFKNELRPQIYNSTNINRLELLMNSYLKRIENWSNSIELTSRLKSGDLYLSTERGRINIANSVL